MQSYPYPKKVQRNGRHFTVYDGFMAPALQVLKEWRRQRTYWSRQLAEFLPDERVRATFHTHLEEGCFLHALLAIQAMKHVLARKHAYAIYVTAKAERRAEVEDFFGIHLLAEDPRTKEAMRAGFNDFMP